MIRLNSGAIVIDIGAWNGAYSFEAKRRGAARVLATDHYVWNHPEIEVGRASNLHGPSLIPTLKSGTSIFRIYRLTTLERSDVVLFLGVFYHLLDPIAALERVAKLASEVLIVETHTDALRDKPTGNGHVQECGTKQ